MNDKEHRVQPTTSVSAIIPAYNVEKSLGCAIDSALAQNLPPAEIIVVNDGSTDSTADVARRYGDRITYIEQANAGQGAARNRGLEIASGRYVAFLDADDYWLPGFLESCVGFLESTPEPIAVFTAWIKKRKDGSSEIRPAIAADRGVQNEGPRMLESFYKFWSEHDHVQTGAVMIRSEAAKRIGGMRADLRISQDLEYWGHIANHGKWGFIPKPLLVNTSESVVLKGEWVKRYTKRRRLCPTVEQWQSRILSQVKEEDMPYFRIIRGRVAAGYVYAKISAGDNAGARHIMDEYANEMPGNSLTNWGKRARVLGELSWNLFCRFVRFREHLKALR